MRILKHYFIVKRPFTQVKKRAEQFMSEYFGEALKINDEGRMNARRMGFEDGYVACLKDLGINQTIENIKLYK